jgi:hypothetical protein
MAESTPFSPKQVQNLHFITEIVLILASIFFGYIRRSKKIK